MRNRILLVGEQADQHAAVALQGYELLRADEPYKITGILNSQPVDCILIGLRDWNTALFHQVEKLAEIPRLIFLKGHLDKTCECFSVPFWKEPYKRSDFETLLHSETSAKRSDYQALVWMVNRKFIRIPLEDILLVQKQPQNQVLVYTREGDHFLTVSLTSLLYQLPVERFERISDNMVIPVSSKKAISRKGFAFRGGYLPITQRFQALQRRQVHDELI